MFEVLTYTSLSPMPGKLIGFSVKKIYIYIYIYIYYKCFFGGGEGRAGMAQRKEHSPPINVDWGRGQASTPYMGFKVLNMG